ncbi:MAG: hypothetical protein KIS92_21145 [Planctomycetota bacterium]|nr:hypothetical protein [Planctomycetota bacterium]
MKAVILAAALACAACLPAAEQEPLVVHEWGVMVRSSVPVVPHAAFRLREEKTKGEPRAMLAPPGELLSGAPEFVARASTKPVMHARAWDKPVIHFYGPEGLAVRARILTPHGRPLAYYPRPAALTETFWWMSTGATEEVGMEWSGRLSKAPTGKEPEVAAGHWWKAAREIPSMYFSCEGGAERFIFWEAYAFQEPLVTATVNGETLDVKNAGEEASGPVLAIVRDGGARGWVLLKDVPAKGSVQVSKGELFKAEAGDEALLAACRSQWEAYGMTREEARAIVEVWKPDLLGAQGFLLVSRMSTQVFDKLFPLEIEPKPASVVRAPVVFDTLPGVEGRLAWVPGLRKLMDAWGKDLGHEEFAVREKAYQAFRRTGDLAEPVLKELAQSADPTVAAEARRLIENLTPQPVSALPAHGRGSPSKLVPAGPR